MANAKPTLKELDDRRTGPVTPIPTHPKCTLCQRGAILIKGLCEPCYRNEFVVPIIEERDRLYKQISNMSLMVASHEAALVNAKIHYNKAATQNWSCKTCGQVFDYYGNLFEHEKDCKVKSERRAPIGLRRRNLEAELR